MNKAGIIISTLHRVNEDTTPPESYGQPPYQHSAYTPCQDCSIEEKSDFDKILEVVERRIKKLKDSQSHQNFKL